MKNLNLKSLLSVGVLVAAAVPPSMAAEKEPTRAIANLQCQKPAERAARVKFRNGLSAEEKKRAKLTVRSTFLSTFERDPPDYIFEVLVDSNLPGWTKYQVTMSRDSQGHCLVGVVTEIDSE